MKQDTKPKKLQTLFGRSFVGIISLPRIFLANHLASTDYLTTVMPTKRVRPLMKKISLPSAARVTKLFLAYTGNITNTFNFKKHVQVWEKTVTGAV